jgi:hypothetical protein
MATGSIELTKLSNAKARSDFEKMAFELSCRNKEYVIGDDERKLCKKTVAHMKVLTNSVMFIIRGVSGISKMSSSEFDKKAEINKYLDHGAKYALELANYCEMMRY